MAHPLEKHIALVPDFPKPGIAFRDISPLLKNYFHETIAAMAGLLTAETWAQIDAIAGIEARGFSLAGGLAQHMGKGFVPVRKPGKLPPPVLRQEYALEYGVDALEMHLGTGRILLVDDVLATGGTLAAAASLCENTGYTLSGLMCLINLRYLNDFGYKNVPLSYLISFD